MKIAVAAKMPKRPLAMKNKAKRREIERELDERVDGLRGHHLAPFA